jgi:rhomboid protease GluP
MVADGETMRFARAVLNRPYKFTIILLVVNLFIFLLMWQASGMTGGALWAFPEPVLVAFGAKLNSLINEQHQWWRFVTPMFVHINLPHVLINMYSLWVVGPYVEKLYGSAKFVVFWVLTGIAGVVASYLTVRPGMPVGSIGRFLFKTVDVPSAGASGALFGLVGVLFVFGIKFRHELPEGFKRAFGTGLLPMIMLNLFIGYMGRGFIDNAAHLGGLVSGGILALAVDYRRPGEKSGIATIWQVLQVLAIALVAVSFVKTVQHYKDPQPAFFVEQPAPVVDAQVQKFVAFAKAMNDGQEAFYLAMKDRNLESIEGAIKTLEAAPSLDPAADDLRQRLKQLLIRARDLNLEPSPAQQARPAYGGTQSSTTPTARSAQEEKLATDFTTWSKDYNTWLKTIGRTYGLKEVTDGEPTPK